MESPSPRSYLFVPGNRPDRYAKAIAAGADAVIVDLEDAVPPQDKSAARAALAAWLSPEHPVHIRVNGAESQWFRDDLAVCNKPGVAGVLLPKAERAEDEAPHFGALRKRVRIPKPACSLDKSQNWRRCGRMIGESANIFDSFRFRQKHASHAWLVANSEILTKPLTLCAVHANVHRMFRRKPCG